VLDAFTRKLRGRPEVRRAWDVTGDADCMLHLQLVSMEVYEGFAREVFHGNPMCTPSAPSSALREVILPASAKPQQIVGSPAENCTSAPRAASEAALIRRPTGAKRSRTPSRHVWMCW
jgi:hypothetical protein